MDCTLEAEESFTWSGEVVLSWNVSANLMTARAELMFTPVGRSSTSHISRLSLL